jgi:hypothetical protein
MTKGIEFGIDMVLNGRMYENFQLFTKAVFLFLKIGTTAACFQVVGKIRCDKLRLKINLRTGIKTSKQPFMKKAGMPSSPTDFDGPRRLAVF